VLGRTVAHYTIVEKLGEGGMGVVYKARDTHLDRFVAIKVLPAEKVADPERKRRFVQEAKAASALNHPNIVTIHDIASAEGVEFIAMEYVVGRTLDEVIGRKGLKLNEALGHAIQVADALAKAHAAGIVHRDLKPSNIMVTGDGLVKVLDFGLAKLTEPVTGDAAATASLPRPHTEEGAILGTVAYMSPEQAEGKPVDARSDIFSFGAVLYQMLTGHRAFQGDSKLSTLAAILRSEPAPVAQSLPSEVVRALERCLRKDPQRRWQSMSDLKVVLQDLKEESESGKLPGAPVPSKRPRPWGWIAAVAAVAAGAAWWFLGRPPPAPEIQFSRLTLDSGFTGEAVLSPDGKLVAYTSDRSGEGHRDIWVQQMSGGQPLRLTRHPADDQQPSFSPDGSRIAFRSNRDGGGIYVIDTLGGEERRIVAGGYRPTYSPDGSSICYISMGAHAGATASRMFLVPAQGGVPRPFQPEYLLDQTFPVWSPDGKHVLFSGMRGQDPGTLDWWVAPVDGGPAVATGAVRALAPSAPVQFPMAWAGKYVYFVRGTTVEGINMFRVEISRGDWRVRGPAQRVTSGSGIHFGPSISSDGSMVFTNMSWVANLWSVPLDADQGKLTGEPRQITQDATSKAGLSVSRDGSRFAYVSFGGIERRRLEIRVREAASGREAAVPARGFILGMLPRLSEGGSLVAYRDLIEGKPTAVIAASDGSSARQICERCAILDFLPGATEVLVRYGVNQVVRQNVSTGSQTPLLKPEDARIEDAQVSADGRWLVFLAGKPTGEAAIYVSAVRDTVAQPQEWVRVAEDATFLGLPRWSPDGNLVYFVSERDGRGCVWAQRLDPAAKRPAGAPFAVLHTHPGRHYLNYPRGFAQIAVARDTLMYGLGEITGNVWTARLR